MEPMINSTVEGCTLCGTPIIAATESCHHCGAAVNLPEATGGEASVPEAVVGGVIGGVIILGGLIFVVASLLGLAAILFGGGN